MDNFIITLKKNIKNNLTIILFFISILIFISFTILTKYIGDMDEIWNYNFANNIAKGLVPYKDFNIVQTPLTAMIVAIFLKIFPNSMIVCRGLGIVLNFSIFILIYLIFKKLKINKYVNISIISCILFLIHEKITMDYNFLSLFWVLLIIFLELKKDINNSKNNLIIGVFAGILFITKQSIGLLVCGSIIFYEIIIQVYNYRYNNKKIDFKSIIYRVIGICIPICLFVIYLIICGAFNDFIDYAILGITTFSNKISYFDFIKSTSIINKILAVIIPVNFIILLVYIIKNKDKQLLKIFLLSLSMFSVVFPISDDFHFLVGIVPSIIMNIYILYKILIKTKVAKINFLKIFIKVLAEYATVYILILNLFNFYVLANNNIYYSKLNHFEGIPSTIEFDNQVNKISEYVKNNDKKTYILNFNAAIYMIPIDRYNKYFDLLLLGNIGVDGINRVINEIQGMQNTEFLILNKSLPKNWQHPHEITNYIEENYNNTGSIDNFEVYEK